VGVGVITNRQESLVVRVKTVLVALFAGPGSQNATYKGQTVPVAVARICQWTWMCAPAPRGPNIHANATGYKQLAKTFKKSIL
jgi:hypothetical protein